MITAPRTQPMGRRVSWALHDAMVVTKRNLMQYLRVPPLLVFSTIQPVMFVLLFRFVFGGAIKIPGVSYVDYLMPGIFIQTAVFGSMQTGVGLASDLKTGMVDRFRSLPMARSAVLAGRTTSDMVRNAFVIFLMVAVGYMVSFRFHGNAFHAVLGLVIALAFGHAFSWISAYMGLLIGDVESVQAAGFVWIFPLTFASSAFAPVASMPGWLQAWAKVNPVSLTVDAIRSLTFGAPDWGKIGAASLWTVGILIVFAPLAIRRYRSLT